MEKKHDNLEDLFRKSLENYSVPGLRPWEEERKILEELKKKRRLRRPGGWVYFLIASLVVGSLIYMGLPRTGKEARNGFKGKQKATASSSPPKPIQPEKSKDPVETGSDQKKTISFFTDSLKKTDMSRLGHVADKMGGSLEQKVNRHALVTEPKAVTSSRLYDKGEQLEVIPKKVVDQPYPGETGNYNVMDQPMAPDEKPHLVHDGKGLVHAEILLIPPLYTQIKSENGLTLPKITLFKAMSSEIKDGSTKDESSWEAPPSFSFRQVSAGVLAGIDNLVLPRNNVTNVEFVSSGFNESPSISFSGILHLSPRFMIRSGINIHRFREKLTADINKTITDTVYAVKERQGTSDITITESTRELTFKSSHQFSNSYTSVSIPISLGYDWAVGRGSVSLFAGVLANFSLKETAIASARYNISKSMVSDYQDGMDPDLEGYIHYNRYNEYTTGFNPVELKLAPLSMLFDARIMGRLPLKSNLDVAAEISYAQGITSFFAGNSDIRPSVLGAKVGLMYRWKKQGLSKGLGRSR